MLLIFLFKGESEYWKMLYTISPNQKVKDYEGEDITSNVESIRLKYKGNIKALSDVHKYRIGLTGAGTDMVFDKITDKRFKDTGEIYVENHASTSINKNENITGWVLLDLNKEGGTREGIDLKPE